MNNYPFQPTQEQVRKWVEDWAGGQMKGPVTGDQLEIATQAARWGADLELDACCGVLRDKAYLCGEGMLRAARRPKPPSLNEQALKQLDCVEDFLRNQGVINTDPFRRALENLPND